MLKEFREFIARGNVMDLAVGIIIGAAWIVLGFILQVTMGLLSGIFQMGN